MSLIIPLIVSTVFTGNFPTEVSPLNMTASAPSITEFATSLTSALVATGLCVILSSICVAMITGFAFATDFFTISFCIAGTL